MELRWWDLPAKAIQTIVSDLCAAPTRDQLKSLIDRFQDTARVARSEDMSDPQGASSSGA